MREKLQLSKNRINIILVYVLYFFCLLPVAIFAFKKPYYNWDMLPYMAIVVKMEHSDINQIHKITYQSAKDNIPSQEYDYLVANSSEYRKKMAESAVDFYQQLPFYVVKPLYIGSVYLCYKAGYSLPKSTVLPSIISYLLIGLLLFYWLSKYFKLLFACAGGLLIMFSIYMVSIARESTPDCLSAFFIFSAIYFIVEKPSVKFMFLFFLLAIFTRLDNVITCFIILSFLTFIGKWKKEISLRKYLLLSLLIILLYFSITFLTTAFGWSIFYYPTFASSFDLSHSFHATFPFEQYLELMYSKALTGMVFSQLTTFLLIILLILYPWPAKLQSLNFDQLFSLLMILIIIVRFVLFPNISDRFYIAFYLVTLILLIRKFQFQLDRN
jgi:hypothetical protein